MGRGETGWEEGAQHYEDNSFVSCSFLKVFHCPVGQSNKTSITEVLVSGRLKGGVRSARRVGEGPGQSLEACAREGGCQLGTSQGCPWRWGLWARRGLRASLGHRAQQLEGEGDSAEDSCGPKGSRGGGLKAWGDNRPGLEARVEDSLPGGLHTLGTYSRGEAGGFLGAGGGLNPRFSRAAKAVPQGCCGGHLHPLLSRCLAFTTALEGE